MSLRKVLIDWLEVVDPDCTDALPPPEQREFCADVYSNDYDHLLDALAEGASRNTSARNELIESFRHGDFLQLGAVVDKLLRSWLIGSDYIAARLREVQEQESFYAGDE